MQKACQFYFLPIGGTATAALAGLLFQSGYRVQGVDAALYPPTSELLAELGIPVRLGYDPQRLPQVTEAVVIGNAVPKTNPEVQAVLARGLPYTSQAACFGERFCQGKKTVVVAGTHGKTTTTALTTHLFTAAGLEPTALIGGVPRGGKPWRLGSGAWTVVEGDEYNTAFFDRGPKFLHYHPFLFLLGNVEFDHADLYPDMAAILAAFRAGLAQVPSQGFIVANLDHPGAREAARGFPRVFWYGQDPRADLRCERFCHQDGLLRARVRLGEEAWEIDCPLVGKHNLANLLGAVAAALLAGASPEVVAQAAAQFPGVRRRLDVVGQAWGVTVVDDFAHHPTAVGATLEAAQLRFPGSRVVVAFEPRSLSAGRACFLPAYEQAFGAAQAVVLAPVFHRQRLLPEELLDRELLAAALQKQGVQAKVVPEGGDPLEPLLSLLRPGDVALVMSSGDFGGLPRRLLAALQARER